MRVIVNCKKVQISDRGDFDEVRVFTYIPIPGSDEELEFSVRMAAGASDEFCKQYFPYVEREVV